MEAVKKQFNAMMNDMVLLAGFLVAVGGAMYSGFLFGYWYSLLIFAAYIFGLCSLNFVNGWCECGNVLFTALGESFVQQNDSFDSEPIFLLKSKYVPLRAQEEPLLLVHYRVNKTMHKLFNRLFEEYVSSWYNNITADPSFHYELRIALRSALSSILQRCLKVDFEKLILNKLIPIYISHVNECSEAEKNRQVSHLHIAVLNRESEISYLRAIAEYLIKLCMDEQYTQSSVVVCLLKEVVGCRVLLPLADAACNPTNLNALMLQCLKGNVNIAEEEKEENIKETYVELLENFVNQCKPKGISKLLPDLNRILRDQSLLPCFMKFTKKFNSTHLVQFCLDIDKFNEKMLKPELTFEERDNLYKDAWDIYSLYFSPNSPNCIDFSPDLGATLRKILSKDVTKLRTSAVLYEAYEYVYCLLEKVYCHEFHNSKEYYDWMYGCYPHSSNKSDSSAPTQTNSPVKPSFGKRTILEITSRLSKIKDALKSSSVMEGQIIDSECKPAEFYMTDTEEKATVSGTTAEERNLNNWAVTIPTTNVRTDPSTGKPHTILVLRVRNEINPAQEDWLIERTPADFYYLESKVIEFHGKFPDVQLPPKPTGSSKLPFVEKAVFEAFVNKLLKKPNLKHSDLLYTFLKTAGKFHISDVPPRKSPTRSGKDKGQYLESFIRSLMMGCIQPQEPVKYEVQQECKPLFHSDIFEDNFGVNVDICTFSEQIFTDQKRSCRPVSPSAAIIFLAMNVYSLSQKLVRFLFSLHMVFGGLADILLLYKLRKVIRQSVSSSMVAYLLDLLNWSLFENNEVVNDEEIRSQLTNTLSTMKDSWLHPLYMFIFTSVQNPVVNKQLFYCILDAVLAEVFPEMAKKSEN